MLGENLAAGGSSGLITATGAPVNRDDATRVVFDGIEDFLDGIWGVSIINNYFKGLTAIETVHATLYGVEIEKALLDGLFS